MINIEKDYDYLHIQGIDESTFTDKTLYDYKGFPVPRVTRIIEACQDQSGLISWAANMPYKIYKSIKEKALKVGSDTHEMIDNYIKFIIGESTIEDKYPNGFEFLDPSYQESITTAYYNFKIWYNDFVSAGYNITKLIAVEIPIITNIYGGTADAIVEINNKWNYILDFKTSKEISYSYILQLAAYEMAIMNGFCEEVNHIDGVGIIRVDKSYEGIYNDLFIQSSHPNMDEYRRCFLSMVETYYRLISTNSISYNYIENYVRENCI